MAFFIPKFEDIRIIISVQGYQLNNRYIIREIGFWSPNLRGVIPFNCKLNLSQADSFGSKNIQIAENEIHGIKLRKIVENGLPSSEAYAVIKTLYHLTKRNDYDAVYIGILKDENISSVIFNSGLGKYVFEIETLELLRFSNPNFPAFTDFKYIIGSELKKYKACKIHEKLRNNEQPLCAKNKAEIVANHILQLRTQQQQLQPIQPQSTNFQGQSNDMYNIFTQQMSK